VAWKRGTESRYAFWTFTGVGREARPVASVERVLMKKRFSEVRARVAMGTDGPLRLPGCPDV